MGKRFRASTVLLVSAFMIFAFVQPEIRKKSRVCFYKLAGVLHTEVIG